MFSFQITEDGSPTVRIELPSSISRPEGLSEAMHSLKGAFSETVYIYGTAIETCLERGFEPRILSMGLGLGYVEMLSTAMLCRHKQLERAEGESFEIIPELREWFTNWLFQETQKDLPSDFKKVYDEILLRTSLHTTVPAEEIRSALASLVREKRWRIRDALTAETTFRTNFGAICFDAFSSKSTPELWTEDFLKVFFDRACAPACVLSTYACTGALKRSLKAAGFELTIREGFSSKRDSTFAVRTT
jgi:hypothetical protein